MKRLNQMRAWMALGGVLMMAGMAWTEVKAASVSTDCTGTGGTDPCCSPGDTYVKTESALSVNPSSVTACPGTVVTVTNAYWYRRWQTFTPANCKADEAVTPTDEVKSPSGSSYNTSSFTVTNGMTAYPIARGMGNVSNTVNVAVTAKTPKNYSLTFVRNTNASSANVSSFLSTSENRLRTDDDGGGTADYTACVTLQNGGIFVDSTMSRTNILYGISGYDNSDDTVLDYLTSNSRNVYIAQTIYDAVNGKYLNGFAVQPSNPPLIVIRESADPVTVGHELGHTRNLGHRDTSSLNIMYYKGDGTGARKYLNQSEANAYE